MRSFLSVCFVVVLWSSCSSPSAEGVLLYNNISFSVEEGEYVQQPDLNLTNEYLGMIDAKDIQIPMFKCIRGTDITLYVGLPAESNLQNLFAAPPVQMDTIFENNGISNNSFYRTGMKSDLFVFEYAEMFGQNLVYLTGHTKSKKVIDTKLNGDQLHKRFKQQQ